MKLMKFYAEWCGPCKVLSKTMEGIDFGSVQVQEIDVDKNPELAMQYTVRGVPTLILLGDEGQILGRTTGSYSAADIKQFVGV
jgi:thioredoxin 1